MFIFILILCIPIAIILIKFDSFTKKRIDEKECEVSINEYNAYNSLIANHVCGLPLGEDSECKLYLNNDQIIIDSSSNIFKLDKNKILDMSIKTSSEIQNSLSGAIGGAMILGPIGAFIGSSNIKNQLFLIIVYKSEQEEKHISFAVRNIGDRYEKTRAFFEDFKSRAIVKKEIEL